MARLFQDHGAPAIFVLIPPVYQVQEELFHRYTKLFSIPDNEVDLEQPNKLLAAAFREQGLILLDPLEHLRKEADRGISHYGRVDRHFNPAGHEAVAEYLFPYIEQELRKVKLSVWIP
jgi:hypothetical protein